MFRILLVDDELLVRNDLRYLLDYSRHGFEICGEAHDGEMALSMIKSSPPDIAILDVNMPGMSGVELNRTIKEHYPSVQTIMLSSYDDYDYVRDCLKVGSIDYLLKHRLDGEMLLSLLQKAVRVQREAVAGAGVMADGPAVVEEPPAFREEAIRQGITAIIRGKGAEADELQAGGGRHGLYPEAALYTAATLQIVPFLLLTEANTDVQTNRLVRQAVDLMQQSLGDIRERTATYVENGRIAVVFSCRDRSEHAAASEAARSMSKLSHSLEMYLNLKSIYAVGHACGSLAKLGESYAAAERALDASSGLKTGSGKRHAALTIEEQKQLLIAIERLDGVAAQRLIGSVFEPLQGLPLHSHTVQGIVRELLQIGDKALKKGSPSPAGASEMERLPLRSELSRLSTVAELMAWLQLYYDSLLALLKERLAAGVYSRHVSQAIAFILDRYTTHVTLELAAGFIGLNASYLSRIFKEETKSTFSEYVNRVRVDAAQKLLESGQYSMKQISDLVGFSTHNYFFKVFKEATGMTPQAYWNRYGAGKGASEKR
ncbi:response regulator [Paenibacillus daejeonensis]|uniref:response regulator n=1 Tax=Paenibacillus daejeonensis TaxID=135193 RepID=UPI00038199B6|nr:response regulator [Paenibacillus daejeonensis]